MVKPDRMRTGPPSGTRRGSTGQRQAADQRHQLLETGAERRVNGTPPPYIYKIDRLDRLWAPGSTVKTDRDDEPPGSRARHGQDCRIS